MNASSTSKQLWHYLYSHHGEKNFSLRHNLFIHLITTKLNEYPSVEEYQLNFKLTFQNLHESGALESKNLQLAAFFHGLEKTYSQWLFAKRSIIQSKAKDEDFLTIDNLTTELLDESWITVGTQVKALAASKANTGRRNCDRPRTLCTFCRKEKHEEDNCWKKHTQKHSARFKHQESIDHVSIHQDSTDDESISKKKKERKKIFWRCSFFCLTVNEYGVYYKHHKD